MPPLLSVDGQTYPVEACLVDKDGTLIGFDHWLEVMRMRAERLAQALSLSRSQLDTLLRFVGLDEADRSTSTEPITVLPRSEAEEAVADYLHSVAGIAHARAREAVGTTFVEVDELFPFERHLRATPGAGEFLRKAQEAGAKTAVVTHDARSAAANHLRALGWADLVDVVVGVEDVNSLKPAPDSLLKACERLGVDPARSLMAGDSPADVGAGRAAGCRVVVGLLSGLGTHAELADADHVLPDLTGVSFNA